MANVFPTLSSGTCKVASSLSGQPLAKYPVQAKSEWVTRVIRFMDDSEQAWVTRFPLLTLNLQYSGVNGYDVGKIVEFFDERLGRYVDDAYLNVFSITVGTISYNWMVFDQDSIDFSENPETPLYFDFVLRLKQLRAS